MYWRDTGLLHSLLNIETMEGLLQQPWVGFSWEGWVIEQIISFLNNNGIAFDGPYFFRTNDSYELGLVIVISGVVWGIEIKLTSYPQKSDLDALQKHAALIGAEKKGLISRTKETIEGTDVVSTNLFGFLYLMTR